MTDFSELPRKHYQVVYADPPWRFQPWSHRGEGRGASQHYATPNLEVIKSIPVGEICANDAALFLWVVQPMLPEALDLLQVWGFQFRTVAFCWLKMRKTWDPNTWDTAKYHKPKLGLGYHTRSGMEQCWLAIRGKGYARQAQGIEQVVMAPLREHSRKPDEVAERIEKLVGDVSRIELFARQRRPGWDSWGEEKGKFDEERCGASINI